VLKNVQWSGNFVLKSPEISQNCRNFVSNLFEIQCRFYSGDISYTLDFVLRNCLKVMSTTHHIAIVDDYPDIRELVARYLAQQGYRVTAVENALALRKLLEVDAPDLIVLDIMMPGEDGLSLFRHISAATTIPVIFLSARTDDLDVILGLELGAEDYLTKPFNPRELLARIKVVLRRHHHSPAPQAVRESGLLRFGAWVLNVKLRELIGEDGVFVPLSNSEFRLLYALLDRPGQIISRDELLDVVSGRSNEPFDRSIDNQVSRLRRKIEDDPKRPQYIRTHWGGGYSFIAAVKKS
jgi:two-component system OmpR family response regulator